MITMLNDVGAELVRWTAWMNAWTAALLVAILLVDRLAARRVAAGWRIALYGAIVVRLLLPVQWASPVGLAFGDTATATTTAPLTLLASPGPIESAGLSEAGAGALTGLVAGTPALTWPGVAALVYATGVVVLLAGWLLARLALVREMRNATRARPGVRSLLTEPARVRLLESPTVGPALVGLRRPAIVLPSRLCEQVERGERPAADLAAILRHEAGHLRRRDHLLAAACQLVVIVAWPVAAPWFAAWRVRQLMEIACDELALRGRSARERRAYGRMLLDLVDQSFGRAPAGAIRVGLLGQVQVALRERLRTLSRPGPRWPRVVQWGLVLVAGTTLVACATTRSAQSERREMAPGLRNQVLITVRVYESAPEHPNIAFDIGQRQVGAPRPPAPPPDRNLLADDELDAFLEQVANTPGASILYEPRLLTMNEQTAEVRVGADGEADEPVDGIRIELTPTIRIDGTITMRIDYEEAGLVVRPPASEFEDGDRIAIRNREFTIRQNQTRFLLATGYIGAPMRLVSVSAKVFDAQSAVTDADVPPEIAPAAEPPHVEYYTVVWDTDVEPPLTDLIPHAVRTTYELPGGGVSRMDVFAEDEIGRSLIQWWRANGDFVSGGKDGARMAEQDEWVQYDVLPTRLRMSGSVVGDAVLTEINWFEMTDPRRTNRVVSNEVTLRTDQAIVMTVPIRKDTWRMVLVRVRAADPRVFRGQTAVGDPDAPPLRLSPAPRPRSPRR